MNNLYSLTLLLVSMLFASCSNMQVGFEEDSPFYNGGVVYIYLDENASGEIKYKVYINNEDSEISLVPGTKTRFGVAPKDIKIEILKGRESASIALDLKPSKDYYLKVQDSNSGDLEIVQVPKESFIDEKKAVEEAEANEKKEFREDVQEGDTEFYYDPNE